MKSTINLLFLTALLIDFPFTWQANAPFTEITSEQASEFARICGDNWGTIESEDEESSESKEDLYALNDKQLFISQNEGLRRRNIKSKSTLPSCRPNQQELKGESESMEKGVSLEQLIQKKQNSAYNSSEKDSSGIFRNGVNLLNNIGNYLSSNRIKETKDDSLSIPESLRSELEKQIQANKGNGRFQLDLIKLSAPFRYVKVSSDSSTLLVLRIYKTSKLELLSVALNTK